MINIKPFNKYINGFQNEKEFVQIMNFKRIKNLPFLFQEFIYDLYGNISSNSLIFCFLNNGMHKYDIVIIVRFRVKRISIKKGIKNSVHVERITDFIHFLIENNVSKKCIDYYLEYQYADGTKNGKGKTRLSASEYKKNNQDKIDCLNNELNKIPLIEKAIDRFIIRGNNSIFKIDALIYGVTNDFIWIKRDDIVNTIINKHNVYSSAVHFGPLTVQPLDRCLNYNSKYERKRFCVQVKWYNIFDDYIEYTNNNIKNNKAS